MIKGKNKVTIFCPPQMDTFINPIMDYLRQFYNVNFFNQGTKYEFDEAMHHSNLAWFEWCVEHVAEATHTVRSCKILNRMHSFEAFTDKPAHVNWNMVDRLIVPNKSVLDVINLFKRFTALQVQGNKVDINTIPPFIPTHKISVVNNAIDTDKFKSDKTHTFKKKICFVGDISFKKNLEWALQLFHQLKKLDPEYTLHIAGKMQEPRHLLYFEQFMLNLGYKPNVDIFYYNWISNIQDFYKDMDFIISSSLYESCHLSVVEAMASGVIPLIYSWYGADNLYPKKYIFNDFDEMVKIIKGVELTYAKDSQYVSGYIKEHYDSKIIYPKIKFVTDYLLYGDIVLKQINENPEIGNDQIAINTRLESDEVAACISGLRMDSKIA